MSLSNSSDERLNPGFILHIYIYHTHCSSACSVSAAGEGHELVAVGLPLTHPPLQHAEQASLDYYFYNINITAATCDAAEALQVTPGVCTSHPHNSSVYLLVTPLSSTAYSIHPTCDRGCAQCGPAGVYVVNVCGAAVDGSGTSLMLTHATCSGGTGAPSSPTCVMY